jgi:probable F420-dependent oxidoreductase
VDDAVDESTIDGNDAPPRIGLGQRTGDMEFWQALSFTETEQLIGIAQAAEAAGFTGVAFADHLVTPATITSRYPYTPDGKVWWDPAVHWPEPWMMSAVVASHTTTLRFITSIYVLPMHELFGAAKAISTAAFLSGNRITLGVGAGWMKDEFLLTGQDFHTRGRRSDEMLTILAKLFEGGPVEHQGEFYSFPPMTMAPVPTKPVPVYVGGESNAALRRAARHQGWFAGGPYEPDVVVEHLHRLQAHRREAGTDGQPFGVLTGLKTPPDVDIFKRLRDEGVTAIINVPWYYSEGPTSSLAHKRDTLNRFAEQFIEPLGNG